MIGISGAMPNRKSKRKRSARLCEKFASGYRARKIFEVFPVAGEVLAVALKLFKS
jgi:hypothetical protein